MKISLHITQHTIYNIKKDIHVYMNGNDKDNGGAFRVISFPLPFLPKNKKKNRII